MKTATAAAQWIVRLTGATQVVLGILFWAGTALGPVSLHMAIGLAFVLALLALVSLAAAAGLRPMLVAVAAGYVLLIPVFGMEQTRLLPGPGHWVVRVAHLALGIGGMILAARLAGHVREHPRASGRRALAGSSAVNLSSENQFS